MTQKKDKPDFSKQAEELRKEVKVEEKIALIADLEGAYCELDHSGDPEGRRRAVNYFMLKKLDGTMDAIPICEYCMEELMKTENGQDFEWYLLVCTQCGATKWLYKANCKNDYPEQVHFIRSCPNCDFRYMDVASDKTQ